MQIGAEIDCSANEKKRERFEVKLLLQNNPGEDCTSRSAERTSPRITMDPN